MAFSGRIAWIDPAGDDPLVPCLILRIPEDAPLHPERALRVSSVAILALCGLEVPQMFKHEQGSSLRCCELDNASAHQMGEMLIGVADLAPEIDIVLFVLRNDTSL